MVIICCKGRNRCLPANFHNFSAQSAGGETGLIDGAGHTGAAWDGPRRPNYFSNKIFPRSTRPPVTSRT